MGPLATIPRGGCGWGKKPARRCTSVATRTSRSSSPSRSPAFALPSRSQSSSSARSHGFTDGILYRPRHDPLGLPPRFSTGSRRRWLPKPWVSGWIRKPFSRRCWIRTVSPWCPKIRNELQPLKPLQSLTVGETFGASGGKVPMPRTDTRPKSLV